MTLGLLRAAAERGARMVSICSGRVRARPGRAARRADRHHALVARRRPGRQYPARHRRPGVAVRRQRPRAHLGRGHRRRRPVPAPAAQGPRPGGRQPRRPADRDGTAPRRRPGPVRRGAAGPAGRRRPRRDPAVDAVAPGPSRSRWREMAARARMSAAALPPALPRRHRPHPARLAARAAHRRTKELLETTDLAVEDIAARVGLGTPANLRAHFRRATTISPSRHRQLFSTRARDPHAAR